VAAGLSAPASRARPGSTYDTASAATAAAAEARKAVVFGLGITQWLGATPADLGLGPSTPRFDLYLDTLLRGLPARTPPQHPHP
jgi:hypothetical protein